MAIVSCRRPWSAASLCIPSLVTAAGLVACGGGGGSSGASDVVATDTGATKVALADNDPANPIQILSSLGSDDEQPRELRDAATKVAQQLKRKTR